jgi:hypothetical protein
MGQSPGCGQRRNNERGSRIAVLREKNDSDDDKLIIRDIGAFISLFLNGGRSMPKTV